MRVSLRRAAIHEATDLLRLRRDALDRLDGRALPPGLTSEWAARLTLRDLERRIGEMDVYVVELAGPDPRVAGWMALDGDRLEGLYTDPGFERRGIASELLDLAERLVRAGGGDVLRTEASPNAEAFYLRRGYVPEGPRLMDGARPLVKRLSAGVEGHMGPPGAGFTAQPAAAAARWR